MDQVIGNVLDNVMPGKTITPGGMDLITSSVRSIVRYVAEDNLGAIERRVKEVIREPSVQFYTLKGVRDGPTQDVQAWKTFVRETVMPKRLSQEVQRALGGVAEYFTQELVEVGGVSVHDDYDEKKVSELRITKANVIRGLQSHDQTIINLLNRILRDNGVN